MSVATMASLIPASSRHLVEPVGLARPVLDEGLAVAGEVAELPDRGRRHEAPPQEPALQQLRDPGGIRQVGLPPREVPDVGSVHQEEGVAVLEQVVDGPPVDPGALHRHVADLVRGEPVPERQELGSRGPESLQDLRPLPPLPREPHAGGDGGLMHIQPGTARDQHIHGASSFTGRPGELRDRDSARRARGDSAGCLKLPRPTDTGLAVPRVTDVGWAPGCRGAYSIFMRRGWAGAHAELI